MGEDRKTGAPHRETETETGVAATRKERASEISGRREQRATVCSTLFARA